ncbi:sterol 24-C-methyltransferase [Yarrowia lipolytica]|uniref:Sterol 24-C-methyltransferase n=2 Tax=Yarrowia lipolytica TaxID=4952 RepID=ERG6_YARLI|nr:YALI0F08701p [Yarrowia lipolytica CLIB122]Q6C2D9.1 RecName: Full=Sterol 24-C-methyltransferase; AltName: Full=Delta(24)-sterol C-methyltransferase [Yarrowia lipolytica CLIB122]AOW06867.1 hypothetical protein YALI1_F12138g [Yarrowia lipolytica]KAB8284070.1 sterol 24-C-methyltransferase [Yarrowia lipolytica]KAE8173657.1 sterol 24-C-methyltransferase [Yarrowia lipolytica]KAJ8055942.1 sterol 24-C-methyltransferase [Yarrowia lipolytica]QNQ00628.1 Sterol 24-C-methyltransferase [Yarrowia lipolyti|eukprot:XP_505173.1 YALI0F08701p [Yarrowia lipolytica CLIB122]
MSSNIKLAQKDYKGDKEFAAALHGKEGHKKHGLGAVMSKNKDAQAAAVEGFFRNWGDKDRSKIEDADEQGRIEDYAGLTKHYYNLVTDFYEYGWGSSFHFSRYYKGEAFRQATARHEHYLAYKMGIQPGMKVLDVGCGVGGPAREIARFTGANIVGLNNNDYQVERGTHYSEVQGFGDQVTYVKGDFMQMDFPDNSFDAVYAIEATVHAPVLEGVYSEIFRVLKPGGVFGVYEWVMTDEYDESNPEHRDICYGIEKGDGIPKMYKREVAVKALENVGFDIEYQEDLAADDAEVPWYYPLAGEWKYVQSLNDIVTIGRTSRLGRMVTMNVIGALEKIGLAPQGSRQVTEALEDAAVNLVAGGKKKLFTPMMLFVSRKPEDKN